MRKFVEQYDICMSPDRIRMATQFRKEYLREFYKYKVTDVREATDEELEHGHVHFHGFEDDEE